MPKELAMRELKAELSALLKSDEINFEIFTKGILLYQEMLKQSQARWYRTNPSHRQAADQLSVLLTNSSLLTPERIFKMADVWLKEGRIKRTGFFGDSVLHHLLSGYVQWYESQRALCLNAEQKRELETHQQAIQQKQPKTALPIAPLQKQGFFSFRQKNKENNKIAPAPTRSSLKIN